MQLPTQAQVNAAARHVGTFVAGVITMFGLSTKIDPATAQNIIAAMGTAINDILSLAGLVTPLVMGYLASRSASPASQIKSVQVIADTGGPQAKDAQVAVLNAAASMPTTAKVVNPALAADAATSPKVTAQ